MYTKVFTSEHRLSEQLFFSDYSPYQVSSALATILSAFFYCLFVLFFYAVRIVTAKTKNCDCIWSAYPQQYC